MYERLRKFPREYPTGEARCTALVCRQLVVQESDTGGNSEDSVVCHLVCPPALLLEA